MLFEDKLASVAAGKSKGLIKPNIININDIRFNGYDHAKIWSIYFLKEKSNIEKIAKIIQPLELYILTAVITMSIACHVDQKPFEYYANMTFESVLYVLLTEFCPTHQAAYIKFKDIDRKYVTESIDIEYIILGAILDKKDYKPANLGPIKLKGRFSDEMFGKIINVSDKSEYEKFKLVYKK